MVTEDSDISEAILETREICRAFYRDRAGNGAAYKGPNFVFKKGISRRGTWHFAFLGRDGEAIRGRVEVQSLSMCPPRVRRAYRRVQR